MNTIVYVPYSGSTPEWQYATGDLVLLRYNLAQLQRKFDGIYEMYCRSETTLPIIASDDFKEGDDVIASDPTDSRSEHRHRFSGSIDEVYGDGTYLVRDQEDVFFI